MASEWPGETVVERAEDVGAHETEERIEHEIKVALSACMNEVRKCDEKIGEDGCCACARTIKSWLRTFKHFPEANQREVERMSYALMTDEATGIEIDKRLDGSIGIVVATPERVTSHRGDPNDAIRAAYVAAFGGDDDE